MGRQDSTVITQFVRGVGVSGAQGDTDWKALASEGIAFTFIKATEDADFNDQRASTSLRDPNASLGR